MKRAVDKAKEEWICRVAKEAEAAVKDRRIRWESVRRLQQIHMERSMIKPRSVKNEAKDCLLSQLSGPDKRLHL